MIFSLFVLIKFRLCEDATYIDKIVRKILLITLVCSWKCKLVFLHLTENLIFALFFFNDDEIFCTQQSNNLHWALHFQKQFWPWSVIKDTKKNHIIKKEIVLIK